MYSKSFRHVPIFSSYHDLVVDWFDKICNNNLNWTWKKCLTLYCTRIVTIITCCILEYSKLVQTLFSKKQTNGRWLATQTKGKLTSRETSGPSLAAKADRLSTTRPRAGKCPRRRRPFFRSPRSSCRQTRCRSRSKRTRRLSCGPAKRDRNHLRVTSDGQRRRKLGTAGISNRIFEESYEINSSNKWQSTIDMQSV